ncbi:UDP-4-amino-4,6-dideoxy-N-acetyl-beta-L-altrosamine transaminase [Paraglaciecola aquimarina]|uniref:UDP-4-amino-4, 6-dideoxy-N-acetyl-beta-L-altrosamine transaminase n=1 Tax=Paraglaciecola algarum TaxID=3050085 RepID=A0ABS9D6T9_9ALTE|nr:UDP-4-amino-4,6-dideoxy-N-acetyl-beta-L-altrosamine transaminase [Paraglaciecola sp. G1-23]MCF2948137.1 UDP-4-amino-4,6-dideoxy-N-acetyl-beta-L-altrosamine transaminase [Paraglaciecola sp. G1-23]
MLPYGKHSVDEDDVDAVIDVLRNQFLTQGAIVPQFETALCEYTHSQYAVAVNSGTSGLHIACLAAGVGQNDLVWTVPNTFVASANCALYCGAKIDFVDIDKTTRNIDLAQLAQKLLLAKQQNNLPKVLILVHFSGLSCDMQTIQKLTLKYGVLLIEDAAHALGGNYKNTKIGCCKYSDMTVLSFHPVKSITSAEGGAVLTNNQSLQQKLVLFAKHGVTRDPSQMSGDSHGPWYYQQVELGYNYRMSDIHAALGLSQLKKIDNFISKRRELAAKYDQALADLPLLLPQISELQNSAWHLYMIELKTHSRKDVFQKLHEKNIGVNVHYIPIHLQPYYQNLGFKQGDFPVAETFYNHALTLPLFPDMTAQQQAQVIQALREVLEEDVK